MRLKNKRDFIIGAIFLALAVAAIGYAEYTTEESGLTVARGNMTPTSYPNFVLGAMAVFSVLLMVANVDISTRSGSPAGIASTADGADSAAPDKLQAIAGIVLTAVYIILLPIAGYILSSIVMLTVFIYLYGGRNIKVIIPLSVGLSLALYWFFADVMDILMP